MVCICEEANCCGCIFINTMLLFCTLSELFSISLWILNVSFTCFMPLQSFFFLFWLLWHFSGTSLCSCIQRWIQVERQHHLLAQNRGFTGSRYEVWMEEDLGWVAKGLANVQKLWPGRIKQLKLFSYQDVDKGVAWAIRWCGLTLRSGDLLGLRLAFVDAIGSLSLQKQKENKQKHVRLLHMWNSVFKQLRKEKKS